MKLLCFCVVFLAGVASLFAQLPKAVPDAPKAFGDQTSWYAVKTTDPAAVKECLHLSDDYAAGWAQGFAAIEQGMVFVSPPVKGWVFAIGPRLTHQSLASDKDPCLMLLKGLSEKFGEAQYFSNQRIVEIFAWARAQKGAIVRAYAFNGDEGQVIWDVGEKTKEEKDLGFNFGEALSPERKNVTDLAGKWSLDPMSIGKEKTPPASGFIGKM